MVRRRSLDEAAGGGGAACCCSRSPGQLHPEQSQSMLLPWLLTTAHTSGGELGDERTPGSSQASMILCGRARL
eukprot:scaffold24789_cov62-Phaeocystis_antarctica.AAC.1